jgi:hypothetical protein
MDQWLLGKFCNTGVAMPKLISYSQCLSRPILVVIGRRFIHGLVKSTVPVPVMDQNIFSVPKDLNRNVDYHSCVRTEII